MRTNRQTKLMRSTRCISILLAALCVSLTIIQAADPLLSWNEGPAKQAIVEFVNATTSQGSPQFVPPEERVATFGRECTLWVEHPMYTGCVYWVERVPSLVKTRPELNNKEPFKTVLSGNREAMAKLSQGDLMKILVVTLTGMSVDDFTVEAKQ